MILEILISLFLIAGSLLIFVASIGILRLPDIYMRMHALTKASSLGIMFLLFGAMLYYPTFSVILKAFAIIIFLYLTIPVSANLLGKSALEMNAFQWTKKNKMEKDDGR